MVDAQGFRRPTEPNLVAGPVRPWTRSVQVEVKDVGPVPDARFPNRPAQMSDGRLVTDYRPHCARNIPTGAQNATKQWMIHSADSIIQESRRRQAVRAGADQAFDAASVPPPTTVAKCTPFSCGVVPVSRAGIGRERQEGCPELFGTFSESYSTGTLKPVTRTRAYQGGRNTPRGGGGEAYNW
jgi:hypothetical protein